MPEILSLRSGSDNADGPSSGSPMGILYVKGSSADVDKSTIRQLEKAVAGTRVKAFANGDAITTELRSSNGSVHALVTSPTLNNVDTTQLISRIRDAGAEVAIVPIVTAADQGLRAIAAGADAVLLLVDGSLVEPQETLRRIRESARPAPMPQPVVAKAPSGTPTPAPEAPAPTVSAGRRMLAELRKLQGFLDMGKRQTPDPEHEEGRVLLKARLDEALDARVKLEGEGEQRGAPAPWTGAPAEFGSAGQKAKGVSPFSK